MHIHKVACLFGEICLTLLGQCTPYGTQHTQHDKAACRHACHGQHRAADNHTEHGACGQPFTDAAQQHQQQRIAHRDAQALGDSLVHRLLHAAKAVGQQRLHREHGKIDAKAQQAGAEQHIQDGIHRQIHHRRAEAVHQCTGQQLFLQRFRGGQKFSLGSFGSSLTESTFWVCLIYGIFINLQNYGIDQNYVQRYLTAKSDKQAKFSALFGGYLFIPVSAVFFMIGTALYAYYKTFPELLPAGVEGDAVFPYFIVHALPTGLTGLLIASIFAAGMSTVATSITSSATIILTDYYARYINKRPTEKQSVRALYVSNVLIGIIGIFVALAFLNVESALDAWWALSSIFSGGMLGLFLLGYISKKARNVDAVLGVICGIIVVVWMSLSPIFFKDGFMSEYASPFHANLTIVVGTIVIFLAGFLSMRLLKTKK